MPPGIASTSAVGPSAARSARDVNAIRTPVSRTEIRSAIGAAYRRLTGLAPSSAMLETLTAQASLETASGSQMYNYNFGGIKGASPRGDTANYLTHEVVDGHQATLRQGFRAYTSLDQGAEDFVRVLAQRFGPALASAQVGDVRGFAHALKQAGYYTASEGQYASALLSLSGKSEPVDIVQAVPSLQASVSGATFPVQDELSRVLDALSHSALRIASSDSDE